MASVRTATDCTHRAEECRRLAKLAVKAEDFGHFLEMAETWELLAKQRKTAEQVAAEQTAEKQVTDEQTAAEQVAAEQVADEQVTDEEVSDEQLADILALADAIANGRHTSGRLINVP